MCYETLRWAKDHRTQHSSESHVLLVLALYAHNKDHIAYPSLSTLAADTELSERTVRNALNALVTQGLLERKTRRRPDGTRNSNVYRLCVEIAPAEKNLPDCPQENDDPPTGNERAFYRQRTTVQPAAVAGELPIEKLPAEEPCEERTQAVVPVSTPPTRPEPWPRDFWDQFWSRYKLLLDMGEMDAFWELHRLHRDTRVSFAEIMEGVERIPQIYTEDFYPLAKNWLRKERWKDKPRGNSKRWVKKDQTTKTSPVMSAYADLLGLTS